MHIHVFVNTFKKKFKKNCRLTNLSHGPVNSVIHERVQQTDRAYSVDTFCFQYSLSTTNLRKEKRKMKH